MVPRRDRGMTAGATTHQAPCPDIDEAGKQVPYTLDNGWEQARHRLKLLEACYDPSTTRRLRALGVDCGWHCLEVGAGGGSIARWLASEVGPEGRVLAVDLDTRFVQEVEADNLDVRCLDVTAGDLPQ